MAEPELVTIGIPAYNSARFLSATVRSALAQDYPRIRIVISVDPSTDGTADLAGTLAEAHGFEVVLQPRRLGWIANSNAVLNAMDSPFGMILPHDDLLLPSYVSRCMAALKANETAAVACSDLQFIREGWITTQLELRGDRPDRVVRCIEDGFDGVNYRGVIRFDRFARRDVPDAIGGFAGDTLWMLRMAIAGEVIRVPEVLYQKRLRKHSAHAAWKRMKKRMLDRRCWRTSPRCTWCCCATRPACCSMPGSGGHSPSGPGGWGTPPSSIAIHCREAGPGGSRWPRRTSSIFAMC